MSEWIKVEDDIPEIGHQAAPYNWSRNVLIFLSDKTIHIACLTDTGFWRNREGKYNIDYKNVTHWMEIPSAPEE